MSKKNATIFTDWKVAFSDRRSNVEFQMESSECTIHIVARHAVKDENVVPHRVVEAAIYRLAAEISLGSGRGEWAISVTGYNGRLVLELVNPADMAAATAVCAIALSNLCG